MSPSPQLAPPGSSSYDSATMHVGDGTWDAGRDNFLLPNLVGLNFATMRYNGMGNRFFTMNGYHALVRAHGVIAGITFLGIVPLAIFLMRFYGRNPRLAFRSHIWLQILTLLLSTVAFILGFMAVGPERSLSNPHHGIGVAIYVLIWVQVLGGCLVHSREKGKSRRYKPMKVMLHQWFGRSIALLGIVQVALGLTVYGSPLFLFVLYALFVFALVVLWFILSFLAERKRGEYGSYGGSYYSEEVNEHHGKHDGGGGKGKWLLGGAAALGLASLWRRRSNKERRGHPSVVGTETSVSSSYISDEKYSNVSPQRKGVGHRLLQIAAVGGAVAAARKLFGRGKDDESDVGPYRPPLGGNQSVTTDSMSRIEEGRPPVRPTTPLGNSPGYSRPTHPLAQPPMTPGSAGRRNSGSSYSYDDSFVSGSPSRRDRRSHTFRDALAAGGAVFAVRSIFKNRRQRKEDLRAETLRKQRIEQEKIQRMESVHKYTGDGVRPPRRNHHHRMGSQTASDISSSLESGTQHGMSGALPAAGVGAAAASALADRNRIRPVGQDPPIVVPGPATAGTPADIPPPPPPHHSDYASSGSEVYTTASGRQRQRHHHHGNELAAGLAGAAIGATAAEARRRTSGRNNGNTDSMESPPVSVKINMHNDGRKVTLRRLTEEEALAQREARRKERQAAAASRRRRNSSLSSSDLGEIGGASAGASADRRWRRTEALEAQQAAENEAAAAANLPQPVHTPAASLYPTPPPPGTGGIGVDPTTGQTYHVPLPPPIPGSVSNLGPAGSITSPGTETSGATEYANNRRRRRAERAQARLAREGRAQNTVDFT